MEVSIPSLSQDRPVYYTIHVSLSGHTSYIIKRRYSEFATFCDELEREIGERSPVPFPEKKWLGNNNEEFLKDRRRRLELYIRGILKLEEWRDSLAVTKFFEISKHMRSEARNGTKENNLQSASEWAKAIAEVRTMIQQIKENTMPGGGIPGAIQSSNMIVSAEERKLQVKARSKLQELEGSLIGDNKLGEGEYMRRRNIVQELSRSLAQIDGTRRSWLVNNITGDVVDSDGYNSSASTYSNGSTGKVRSFHVYTSVFGSKLTNMIEHIDLSAIWAKPQSAN